MLSIVKINSASNQSKKHGGGDGYLFYLGAPSTRQRGDFDNYARGKGVELGPQPFWVGGGASLLGLSGNAQAEHVARLSRGLHPLAGTALAQGAGDKHVMGLDMTFSAPKDFSAVFAAADTNTQAELIDCLHAATRAALGYAETAAVTRHGHGGRVKQVAEASVAVCYTHFASRSLDPQAHVHAFLFNVGKRAGVDEWSALEHRPQFERKLATGALFRVELAAKLRGMGFTVEPDGPYFKLRGVSDEQRKALSRRSREITARAKKIEGAHGLSSAARDVVALNTRTAKSEPPLPELLKLFSRQARDLGLTPTRISAMRAVSPTRSADQAPLGVAGSNANESAPPPPFSIDREELLATLMQSQSCATPQEALALICEQAMGRWTAAECLVELDRIMSSKNVVHLGMTELLTPVFTSRATLEKETAITQCVRDGASDSRHRLDPALVSKRFDALETGLRAKLGVAVSFDEQRAAALHVTSQTGTHAFIEGWAGTGKTTLLRATAEAYREAGFDVLGCCQSASAAQNLSRETGVRSRTIASLLVAVDSGRAKLSDRTVLFLDEAGLVGSREFGLVQDAARAAGAKLVSVGDSKQLQPIEGGGIFRALVREHGAAEISSIHRQRTDFDPLFEWLESRSRNSSPDTAQSIAAAQRIAALRSLPDDAKMRAAEALCSADKKLHRGFLRWRARFDHEWLRGAVESFAVGAALPALRMLDERGRLRFSEGPATTARAVVDAWGADQTSLASKTIIAGTRAEVSDLNAKARDLLVERGEVRDDAGLEIEIKHRDETTEFKRFAPGDRIVFTQNDRRIGVANGLTGTLREIRSAASGPALIVDLDASNERGEAVVRAPATFGRFDHAYCLTNHASMGRTLDSAYVLINPSMANREWTYVAASRSRFATTIFVDAESLAAIDPESHLAQADSPLPREKMIEALAARMSRSRAKGTTLDYTGPAHRDRAARPVGPPSNTSRPTEIQRERHKERVNEGERRDSRVQRSGLTLRARSAIRRLFGLEPDKKNKNEKTQSR